MWKIRELRFPDVPLRKLISKRIFTSANMMPEHRCCNHNEVSNSVCQTLDEMDFERGIWSAALDGDINRVRKLLQKGISIDGLDSGGYTALHYAARAGHLSVCELLIDAGAAIDSQTRAGRATPLHRAVSAGKEDVVMLLLKHGANPGIKDADGNTCFERAVNCGNERIIQTFRQS
ncbi:palmitoyltransferase Hip14 isoform X2 [Bemisia tabaci]|uniref:palmitoyltransferase Hip14 isoform X2 n=1 Tax=Bemisia tabaci TaxID=7038 RepID=UPI0008F9DA70|nr:PREDICTED: ankyrin repeat domain-containing protein 39 [Bemisia tabaci]